MVRQVKCFKKLSLTHLWKLSLTSPGVFQYLFCQCIFGKGFLGSQKKSKIKNLIEAGFGTWFTNLGGFQFSFHSSFFFWHTIREGR